MAGKHKISLFVIFMLLFNIIFSNGINVQAATAADINYTANSSIKAGDNFTITVNTSSITDLYGASIDFKYDASLFSIISVDEGSVFTQSGKTVLNPVSSNVNGLLSFAEILQGNTSGISSSGTLFIIHAKALKTGTVTLNTINNNLDLNLSGNNIRIMLSDSNGDSISYTSTSKIINIISGYTGWYQLNGKWYYSNPATGFNVTGWFYYNGQWYYLDSTGIMKTGWLLYGGSWYYLSGSGVMKTGWLSYNGYWYYLSSSGAMKTGWLSYGGKWYYLSSSGIMKTGWLSYGGKWYYLNGSGIMQTGWLSYGGKWYYLNGSGIMQTGWLLYSGNWYYLNSSGIMQTGWLLYGGKWYYLYSSGIMARNTIIGGYKIGSDGVWIP